MSALSAGREVPSDPAPNTPTPQGHASDTPTPAERRRHGNGITGAESCLFSAQCQETRPGGGRAHLPGWGREGARHWSQGSLTPSGRQHKKSPTSLQAKDGSCFLALQEPRTLSTLVEQSLRRAPPTPPSSIQGAPCSLPLPFTQQFTQQISVQHILCFRECSRSGGFRVQQDEACWSLAPSAS